MLGNGDNADTSDGRANMVGSNGTQEGASGSISSGMERLGFNGGDQGPKTYVSPPMRVQSVQGANSVSTASAIATPPRYKTQRGMPVSENVRSTFSSIISNALSSNASTSSMVSSNSGGEIQRGASSKDWSRSSEAMARAARARPFTPKTFRPSGNTGASQAAMYSKQKQEFSLPNSTYHHPHHQSHHNRVLSQYDAKSGYHKPKDGTEKSSLNAASSPFELGTKIMNKHRGGEQYSHYSMAGMQGANRLHNKYLHHSHYSSLQNQGHGDNVHFGQHHQSFARQTSAPASLQRRRLPSSSVKHKVAKAKKLSKLTFHYDPPVESCELTPYFLVEDINGNLRPKDKEDNIQFRWFRGERCVCLVCGKRGTIQCLASVKAGIKSDETFFCSNVCMKLNFQKRKAIFESTALTKEQLEWDPDPSLEGTLLNEERGDHKENSLFSRMPPPWKDCWTLIHKERSYIPTKTDVERRLRLDATIGSSLSEEHGSPSSTKSEEKSITGIQKNQSTALTESESKLQWVRLHTTSVLKAPSPPPLRRTLRPERHFRTNPGSSFKVMCYNVLAEIYATGYMYPYCPLWALQWQYRSQRLLREILTYKAEIICLQEVQENHYKKFFLPKLNENGYDGVFKRKTRESRTSDPDAVDGCAIFFDRKRFALREKHVVEFNKLAEMHFGADRQFYRRLSKGNVGLILVLEDLSPRPFAHGMAGRSQICVVNTHIFWDPEYKDVKLWQTYILMQQLQARLQHRKLPLVLCGDFNSEVGSAVYEFLSENALSPENPIMKEANAQKLLHYHHSLEHALPLQSAYSAIGEPKFTNYTGHYVGTLDYIWFSHDILRLVSLLEIDEESALKKYTALPSPLHPSDHLPLLAEFTWRIG